MDQKFKRVAVCISGHMRTFKQTAIPLQEKFLSNIAEEWDFFIYTTRRIDWSFTGVPRSERGTNLPPLMTDADVDEIHRLYRPKSLVIDGKDFSSPQGAIEDNGFGRRSMLQRVKMSNSLRHDYEAKATVKYDCVIKMRPDQVVIDEFKDLSVIDPDRLAVLPYGKVHDGLTDTFAMGPPHLMDTYFNLFDNVENYRHVTVRGSWAIELVIQQYLIDTGINHYEIPLNLRIKRYGGNYYWFHDQPGSVEHFASIGLVWNNELKKLVEIRK